MSFLKDLYKADPRRWIPTIFIITFLIILTVFSIKDNFVDLWPGWAVMGLTTIAYIGNLIWEYRKQKRK